MAKRALILVGLLLLCCFADCGGYPPTSKGGAGPSRDNSWGRGTDESGRPQRRPEDVAPK